MTWGRSRIRGLQCSPRSHSCRIPRAPERSPAEATAMARISILGARRDHARARLASMSSAGARAVMDYPPWSPLSSRIDSNISQAGVSGKESARWDRGVRSRGLPGFSRHRPARSTRSLPTRALARAHLGLNHVRTPVPPPAVRSPQAHLGRLITMCATGGTRHRMMQIRRTVIVFDEAAIKRGMPMAGRGGAGPLLLSPLSGASMRPRSRSSPWAGKGAASGLRDSGGRRCARCPARCWRATRGG